MIHKFLGVESVLAPYWTLHLELLFYFICAFLFFLGILHNYKYLVLVVVLFCLMGLVAAAVLFYYEIKVPIVLPFSIAVMFYGALLRSYFLGGNTELRNVLILLALFYFICLLVTQKVYFQNGWLKWFITDVIAFCLFFLLITKMKLHNIIAVYLGRISYSLYLLHSLAIGIIFHFFNDIAFTGIGFLLVIICTITASILMAEFSYRFIETPGLILANKYIVKYRRKEAYV
jgi:peptidoglycan/LPS O-acetylase OafA/YrhL